MVLKKVKDTDSKFINPPKYHNDYRTWKQEIELWTKVTGLAKAKHCGLFNA